MNPPGRPQTMIGEVYGTSPEQPLLRNFRKLEQ